jgi:hypothetical protein
MTRRQWRILRTGETNPIRTLLKRVTGKALGLRITGYHVGHQKPKWLAHVTHLGSPVRCLHGENDRTAPSFHGTSKRTGHHISPSVVPTTNLLGKTAMSDDQPHVPTQPVEYLAVSEGLLGHPTTGEPVVIVTLRPDPPNFAVINIALPVEQAWRLAADIQALLFSFVLLMAVLATGCGARVEVESAKWDSSSGERARTQVEVDVLHTRSREPVVEMKATEPPPKPIAADVNSVINTTIIVNYRGGDIHNHTNIHVNQAAPPRIEERITVQREVQVEPRRQLDERCEFLKMQHEKRVEIWTRFPLGH